MAALREGKKKVGPRRWSRTTTLKEAAKHAPMLVKLEEGHLGPTEETSMSQGDIMALQCCKNLKGNDVVLVHYKSESEVEASESKDDDDEEEEDVYRALIAIPLDNPIFAELKVSPMEDPGGFGYQNWITTNFSKCRWDEQDTDKLHDKSYANSREIMVFCKADADRRRKVNEETSTQSPVPPLPSKSGLPPTLPKALHRTGAPAASISGQPPVPPHRTRAKGRTSPISATQRDPKPPPLPPHPHPVGRPVQNREDVVEVFDPGDSSIQASKEAVNKDEGVYEIQDGGYEEISSVPVSHGSPSGNTTPPGRPKEPRRPVPPLPTQSGPPPTLPKPVHRTGAPAASISGQPAVPSRPPKAKGTTSPISATQRDPKPPPLPPHPHPVGRPVQNHEDVVEVFDPGDGSIQASGDGAHRDSNNDESPYEIQDGGIEVQDGGCKVQDEGYEEMCSGGGGFTSASRRSPSDSEAPYEEIDVKNMMLDSGRRNAGAQLPREPVRPAMPVQPVQPVQAFRRPELPPRHIEMGPKGDSGSVSIENMKVHELCEHLRRCRMKKLARVCEEEGLDGPFLLSLTEETLRDKPFNLGDFEITKLKRVKLGWVPRD